MEEGGRSVNEEGKRALRGGGVLGAWSYVCHLTDLGRDMYTLTNQERHADARTACIIV